MTEVFISYSRIDREFGGKLHQEFLNQDLEVWIDWQDIPISAEWWQEIKTGIEESDNFVFIISPNSMISPICHLELQYARSKNKRIIPVLLEEIVERDALNGIANIPLNEFTRTLLGEAQLSDIAAENWLEIAKINWHIFQTENNFEQNIQHLLEAVRTDLGWVKTHTRLLVRALAWNANPDKSLLLRGNELQTALAWLDDAQQIQLQKPLELHTRFIITSQKAQAKTQRQTIGIAFLALIMMIALAVFAFIQSGRATTEANNRATAQANAEAQTTIAVAAQSDAERKAAEAQSMLLAQSAQAVFDNGDPVLALPLIITANSIPNPPMASQNALFEIVYESRLRQAFDTDRWVWDVAIHPDGKTAISVFSGGHPYVWDIETGTKIRELGGYASTKFVISPDGKYGYSGICADEGGTSCPKIDIGIWEIASGEVIGHFTGHTEHISDIAISADGQQLLSASYDDTVILWDIKSKAPIHVLAGHSDDVNCVAFSPDGQTAVSGANDNLIIQWDLEQGAEIRQIEGHQGAVYAVEYNPYGHSILSGGEDGLIIEWTLKDLYYARSTTLAGDEMRRYIGHEDEVVDIAFHPDARSFVSAGAFDYSILVWRVGAEEPLRRLRGHSGRVNSIAYTRDFNHIVSGAGDTITGVTNPTILVWDISHGAVRHKWKDDLAYQVKDVVFSPDGNSLLISSDTLFLGHQDGSHSIHDAEYMVLVDVHTGEVIRRFDGSYAGINSAVFSPDGNMILSCGCGEIDDDSQCIQGELILWDVATGEIIRRFDEHRWEVNQVAFSPDGKRALSVASEGDSFIWDVSTGKILIQLGNQNPWTYAGTFSPDGDTILIGGNSGELVLWDATNGEKIAQLIGHTDSIRDITFNRDGKLALTGADDKTIILWNMETNTMIRGFAGHTDEVTSVAFSPDEQYAVSGSKDKGMILWDIESGEMLRRYQGHSSWVTSIAYHPTEPLIASSSSDISVILWEILSVDELVAWANNNRYIRELTCEERLTYQVTPYCE